jgi:hypothetical protein
MTRTARVLTAWAIIALLVLAAAGVGAAAPQDNDMTARFQYLSTHGNSSCSTSFMSSIASMPEIARLQGSCCSPMQLQRYIKQVAGLKKYANTAQIPADPYDIPAGLAQKMMAGYDLALDPEQQKSYDYAMQHSAEKGPCCCQCWRWHAYGGLAKLLIRDRAFTGAQITDVWNLSDGCGGND